MYHRYVVPKAQYIQFHLAAAGPALFAGFFALWATRHVAPALIAVAAVWFAFRLRILAIERMPETLTVENDTLHLSFNGPGRRTLPLAALQKIEIAPHDGESGLRRIRLQTTTGPIRLPARLELPENLRYLATELKILCETKRWV